jgi:hypothetical protein
MEFNAVYDYEIGEARLFFTRISDYRSYLKKLNKIKAPFSHQANERENSFFITVSLEYMGNPETLVKGLPRGKTVSSQLERQPLSIP